MAISNYDPGQELSSLDFHNMIGGPLGAIVDAQAQSAFATVDFIKEVGFTPDIEDPITGEVVPGTPIYVNFKYPKMVEPYKPEVTDAITGTSDIVGTDIPTQEVVINGSGSGATAVITVDENGDKVFSVTNPGSGYNTPATATVINDVGDVVTLTLTTGTIKSVPAKFEEMSLEVPILTMVPIPFIRVEEGEIDFHAKITSMEYADVGSQFKASTRFALSGSLSKSKSKKNRSVKRSASVNFKVSASYQRTTRKGSKVDKTYQLGVKVKVAQDEMPAGMDKVLGILEDAIVAQPVQS